MPTNWPDLIVQQLYNNNKSCNEKIQLKKKNNNIVAQKVENTNEQAHKSHIQFNYLTVYYD